MLVYKRSGDTVTPYWVNTVTGVHEKLTWEQIKRGGDIVAANTPFKIGINWFNYSRVSWWPYFVQPVEKYTNPRMLKPDGSRISDNDWYYQE